jgi:hypothetical protein
MKLEALVKQRLDELDKKAEALRADKHVDFVSLEGVTYYDVDSAGFNAWGTSALSLLERVFTKDNIHYEQFRKHFEQGQLHGASVSTFDNCRAVLQAAREDYEGGYIFILEKSLSGEIFSDFVELAKAALPESKEVAAVLACAALEDALKRYARQNGLDVGDKVMQEVVSALKSKGLVAGAQKQLLDTMPKLRDYAMHANWDKLTSADVGSIIGFVEQFLLSHF